MTSQKQLEANRKNAQSSTGARSDSGKAKTRLNALRDGFTGQITTLSDEDRPVFEKFKSSLIADLAPKTVMELSLADSIAWDTWRLNRLRAVEMNMYALGTDNPAVEVDCDDPQFHTAMCAAVTFSEESPKFALMSLYEQRMNRSLHKNLDTLRNLQTERRKNEQSALEEEIIIARSNDLNGLPYEAPTRPNPNGCVFSTSEVLAAANRLTTLAMARIGMFGKPMKVQFAGAGSGTTVAATNLRDWPKNDAA